MGCDCTRREVDPANGSGSAGKPESKIENCEAAICMRGFLVCKSAEAVEGIGLECVYVCVKSARLIESSCPLSVIVKARFCAACQFCYQCAQLHELAGVMAKITYKNVCKLLILGGPLHTFVAPTNSAPQCSRPESSGLGKKHRPGDDPRHGGQAAGTSKNVCKLLIPATAGRLGAGNRDFGGSRLWLGEGKRGGARR